MLTTEAEGGLTCHCVQVSRGNWQGIKLPWTLVATGSMVLLAVEKVSNFILLSVGRILETLGGKYSI